MLPEQSTALFVIEIAQNNNTRQKLGSWRLVQRMPQKKEEKHS
jgi:hypothetical protein